MKWEYNRFLVRSDEWDNSLDDEFIHKTMDRLGEDGWELVSVDDGIAYFKRLKEDNGQEEETIQETRQEDTDQEDTYQPKSSINPGELYSKAYAHIEEGSS